MKLDGSCSCGAVTFSVNSPHPYPFNVCYCSICRKSAGAGGFAINLGGEYDTLTVEGENAITIYQATITTDGRTAQSPAQRHFCRICSSNLWVWDPRWPELVHPFASAIDTELPTPPERTHLMLEAKPNWVATNQGAADKCFDGYPEESIAEWHERLGLTQ